MYTASANGRSNTAALVVGSARWEVGLLVVGLLNEGKHFREGKCNGLDLESKECVFV
jgi:hypothetical protein